MRLPARIMGGFLRLRHRFVARMFPARLRQAQGEKGYGDPQDGTTVCTCGWKKIGMQRLVRFVSGHVNDSTTSASRRVAVSSSLGWSRADIESNGSLNAADAMAAPPLCSDTMRAATEQRCSLWLTHIPGVGGKKVLSRRVVSLLFDNRAPPRLLFALPRPRNHNEGDHRGFRVENARGLAS